MRFKLRLVWRSQGLQNVRQAQEGVRVAKKLAGLEDLKVPQRYISRGSRRGCVICEVDVESAGRSICGKVAKFGDRQCCSAGIISSGTYRSSCASADLCVVAGAVLLKAPA